MRYTGAMSGRASRQEVYMSRWVGPIGLVAWLCALGTAATRVPSAWAGGVTGMVRVKAPVVQEKDRKRYPVGEPAAAPTPPPAARNPLLDVVIYLEGAKAGQGRHPEPVLAQQGKAFEPRVLPIKLGTAVKFPNKDPFYHNVFSYSKIKKFDLGRYAAGQSRSVTFDQIGLVKVFCEIHSHMKAHILVLDTDAFSMPDGDGRFSIQGVPPGKYRLVAWHPSFDPLTQDIQIGDGATKVEIDF